MEEAELLEQLGLANEEVLVKGHPRYSRKNRHDLFFSMLQGLAESSTGTARVGRGSAGPSKAGASTAVKAGAGCWFSLFYKDIAFRCLVLAVQRRCSVGAAPDRCARNLFASYGLHTFRLQLQAGCTGRRSRAVTGVPSSALLRPIYIVPVLIT